MSIRADISVELVKDNFPRIAGELPLRMELAEKKAASRIASAAFRRAPRLEVRIDYPSFRREVGWLADSIEADETPGGESVVNVWAFYGFFQEHGTHHHTAQPFLTPPAIEEEPVLIGDVARELRKL